MARAMIIPLALSLACAFALAGCADNDDDGTDSGTNTSTGAGGGISATVSGSASVSGTGAPSNGTVHKTIVDDDFPNGDFTIKRGDTVNWTATGTTNPHSVTADLGLFDSSPSCSSATPDGCLESGDSFKFKFEAPGTITYKCKVHPTTMTGTITVTN